MGFCKPFKIVDRFISRHSLSTDNLPVYFNFYSLHSCLTLANVLFLPVFDHSSVTHPALLILEPTRKDPYLPGCIRWGRNSNALTESNLDSVCTWSACLVGVTIWMCGIVIAKGLEQKKLKGQWWGERHASNAFMATL